jgi:hypothetical protein
MSHSTVFLIIALVLLVVLTAFTLKGRKTMKYKVTVGDTIYEVTRNRWDALDDTKDEMCFHKANGKKIWLSRHFTITREEI